MNNKKIFLTLVIPLILYGCNEDTPKKQQNTSDSGHNNQSYEYQKQKYNPAGFRDFNMEGAKEILSRMNSAYQFNSALNLDPNATYTIDAAAVPVGYGCSNKQITNGGQEVWLKPKEMTTSTKNLEAKRNYYDPLVKTASIVHGVDPNFIHGIISQESAYNPRAEGPPTKYGTAKGMMQLIDATAKAMGIPNTYDAFRPDININAGTRYLADNMKRFNGNLALVAAAYNAGPGNISKCGNRISPYAKGQTLDYVQKVIGYANAIHKSNIKQQQAN